MFTYIQSTSVRRPENKIKKSQELTTNIAPPNRGNVYLASVRNYEHSSYYSEASPNLLAAVETIS